MEEKQGPFQTRSYDGGVCYFDTLREALDFADKSHEEAGDVAGLLYRDRVVWKISFPSPAEGVTERVRLVRPVGNTDWILEMMDDAVLTVKEV